MTDAPLSGSTRVAGSMEPLYWSPASPVFEMTHEEANKLPQKVSAQGERRCAYTDAHTRTASLRRRRPRGCPLVVPQHSPLLPTAPLPSCSRSSLGLACALVSQVVWFGATQHAPKEVLGFIKPEVRDLPFVLQSNFDVPPSLERLLREVVARTVDGVPAHAWQASRMEKLLTLQEQCLVEFNKAVAAERLKEARAKIR